MQYRRIFLAVLAILSLSRCAPWKSWVAERPDTETFKSSGYGKDNRYYSIKNVEGIESYIRSSAVSGKLMNRQEMISSRDRLKYSIAIERKRNENKIKDYFKKYRKTLQGDEKAVSTISYKESQKPYFDIEKYKNIIPKENIMKVRRLKSMGIIPMTKAMELEIKKNHKYRSGRNIAQNRHSNFRLNKNTGRHYIKYNLNTNNSIKSKILFAPSKIISRRINSKFIDNKQDEIMYYPK